MIIIEIQFIHDILLTNLDWKWFCSYKTPYLYTNFVSESFVDIELWNLLWGGHCRCVMTVSFWGVLPGRSVIDGGTRNWSTWPTALKPKSCVCGENMGRKCNSTSFIPKRWGGVNLSIMVYKLCGLTWFKGFCVTMKFSSTCTSKKILSLNFFILFLTSTFI